jgi:hypothetical protein
LPPELTRKDFDDFSNFLGELLRRFTSRAEIVNGSRKASAKNKAVGSAIIRRCHFGRARVMMYAGFIGCGAYCRFPLSARCSGARHFLILRE